jgi:hypothetical protein
MRTKQVQEKYKKELERIEREGLNPLEIFNEKKCLMEYNGIKLVESDFPYSVWLGNKVKKNYILFREKPFEVKLLLKLKLQDLIKQKMIIHENDNEYKSIPDLPHSHVFVV